MNIERILDIINRFISNYKETEKELKNNLKYLIEEIQIKIDGINDEEQ